MKNNRKIKNYIINRKFQFQFILYSFIPTFMLAVALFFSINIYFNNLMKAGEALNLTADSNYYTIINEQKNILFSSFLIAFPFFALFFFFWGIVISHKIAGPLYRLSKHLKESHDNMELKKLFFRPDDLFQEIPTLFNEYQSILTIKDNNPKSDDDEIPPIPIE